MTEPDWKNCTEGELWKYVATHLAKHGIDTILVGGEAVLVASRHPFDLKKIKKWCEEEKATDAFEEFRERTKK